MKELIGCADGVFLDSDMDKLYTCKVSVYGQNARWVADAVRSDRLAFDFERILPTPPGTDDFYVGDRLTVMGARGTYGGRNCYDWRVSHWGVPVNCTMCHCSKLEDGKAVYWFDTKASVPARLLCELSRRYDVDVELVWAERDDSELGIGDCGWMAWNCGKKDGDIYAKRHGDYDKWGQFVKMHLGVKEL